MIITEFFCPVNLTLLFLMFSFLSVRIVVINFQGEYMSKNYSQRKPSEYNWFRKFFTMLTCAFPYAFYYKITSNLKIEGRENVPKKGFYIVASNHVSAVDPFLIVNAVGRPIAYMAKKELFEKGIMRFFLDWLGAFAVNREKVEVSTFKTAVGIKETDWLLGLFPQGTRQRDGNMDNISRGFATIAKTAKADIIPVAILGATRDERRPFHGNMKIKIGKPIPYMNDVQALINLWLEKLSELMKEE